ncbi:metallophosphoesterase family protein [Planococcus shenhongbingii]|uniref:Metallophosphoesterase n=1 Tax=Planococcus shenhongbingii TaxID=3058398 RepID=A0ABT8NGS5_9BACL|nr:metallophosphoesterase [Planococcus sp. N017]MDN7247026.1 metallophosphoesterase [Planococcus sp. N017]
MKIAVIGDLHYPTLKDGCAYIEEDRQSFYETFLERFFSIPADLYVSIGDLTNFGRIDELEEVYAIIRKHNKPFKHVLGNHDLYAMTREAVLSTTEQKHFHTVSTDSAVLAFLDTALEQDYEDWGGTMDGVQQYWLESIVKESEELPLILFAHHPVFSTTINSEKEKRCIHPDIPIWDILNKKQGAGLYVNGHNHCNSLAAREQWTFLQLSAVLDDQAVRIIEVTDSFISIDSVTVDDAKLRKHAEAIGHAIKHFTLKQESVGKAAYFKYMIPVPVPAEVPPQEKVKL